MKLTFKFPDSYKQYQDQIINYVMEATEIYGKEQQEKEAVVNLGEEVKKDLEDNAYINDKTWKEIKNERKETELGSKESIEKQGNKSKSRQG